MKTKKIFLIIFIILTLVCVTVIFLNSGQSGDASWVRSGKIAQKIQSVITRVTGGGSKTLDQINVFVRKAAHRVEFAALGFSLGGLILTIYLMCGRLCLGSALFSALLVAVSDEYLQSFTGRTSSVSDVLIDLSGAIFGLIFAFAAFWLAWFIRRRFIKKRHG